MRELTFIEHKAAKDMENWIIEGSAIRGWYTCIKTGKKFRGADAEAQFKIQAEAIDKADKEFEAAIEADIEMENEMDAELTPEVQHAAKMALVNAASTEVASDKEGKPKAPRAPRKPKGIDAEAIKAKYPHVTDVITINIEDSRAEEGDTMGILHTEFPAPMSTKLMEQICGEIEAGKRTFHLVRIACVDCGETRVIKSQDAFQVKRCEACTTEYRKANRRKSNK